MPATRCLYLLSAFLCLLCTAARAQQTPFHLPDLPQRQFHLSAIPRWVSFDGQLRGRTESQSSLNYAPNVDRIYELTRDRAGLDLHPLSWFTLYTQFEDNHALGLPLHAVLPPMRDDFDLFLGYIDLHRGSEHLSAGRQLLRFGDERIVGSANWNSNSRSFDGFDLRLGDKDRVDVFSASVVQVSPESLDKHGAGLTFHGVEANLNTLVPHSSLQPFLLVHALPRVVSRQGMAGTQTEVTLGYAMTTSLPHGFAANGMAALQRGSFANDSIRAHAAYIRGSWTAPVRLQPKLEAGYDYASGNSAAQPLNKGAWDQQYPSNHNVFGLTDLFGFENIKQDRLSLSLVPAKKATVLLQGGSLHLASTADGLINGVGKQIFKAPAGGFGHDGIGTEADLSATYRLPQAILAEAGVGHFFPGYAMTHTAHGAPLTVAYLQLTWRFRVER